MGRCRQTACNRSCIVCPRFFKVKRPSGLENSVDNFGPDGRKSGKMGMVSRFYVSEDHCQDGDALFELSVILWGVPVVKYNVLE